MKSPKKKTETVKRMSHIEKAITQAVEKGGYISSTVAPTTMNRSLPSHPSIPPEGCLCASFWTVRGTHKKDCPLYSPQKNGCCPECWGNFQMKGWRCVNNLCICHAVSSDVGQPRMSVSSFTPAPQDKGSVQSVPTPDHIQEGERYRGWQKEFVATFYVYNLKKDTPAGAEKEAVAFISQLLKEAREDERKKCGLDTAEEIIEMNAALIEAEKRGVEKVLDAIRRLLSPTETPRE